MKPTQVASAESSANPQLQVRVGETLRELAHEFGNLLFPLQMMLELQARGAPLAPDELARILRGHVDEMTTLTTRFRSVGHLFSGKLEPCWTSFKCDDVVQAALALCRFPRTADRSIQVDLAAAPAFVHGDRELLELGLAELLDNALRFTPTESKIVVAPQAHENDVDFVVSDTGPGIAAGLQSRVFEPFVYGNRKLDLSSGQLGCGLAIVQRVAAVHRGSAELRQTSAAGSEFALRISGRAQA